MIALLKPAFLHALRWATSGKTIGAAVLFVATAALFRFLGTSFMPEMKEGSISPAMARVPNISIDESIRMEKPACAR